MACFLKAPATYTGEDMAEIYIHGSRIIAKRTLSVLSRFLRPAEGGEFTKRAFMNGKLDLSQAEAVMDVISSVTEQGARMAEEQLEGSIGSGIKDIEDRLIDILSGVEAALDYPDELEEDTVSSLENELAPIIDKLDYLIRGGNAARIFREGASVAILGAPNAGKSSLLNALVGYDRAIVTDLPGTTRDTVEEKAVVGGVLLRLIDTAGIRETDDAVERLGVERSRRAVESADLVIVVADGSHTPLTVEPDILALAARAPHWILAISKDDRNPAVKTAVWRLPDGAPAPEHLVSFNSVMPGGLDALIDTIGDCFPAGVPAGGTLLTNARQAEAIRRALESVRAAHEALTAGLTPDVVLTEAEGALDALGELTGRTAREDMVTRIFERFCVGK